MKAYVFTAFGGVDTLSIKTIPTPVAGRGQVRVRVEAIGINPVEYKIRNGWLQKIMPIKFPAVLGNEIAGTIDQVGEGVEGFARGDQVFGFTDGGAYAEYTVTRAVTLIARPTALTATAAVTLPIAAETTQRVLAHLSVQPGETVIVNGAAGGVGNLAVQFLVAMGVTVIGTSSEDNHDFLRSLGVIPVLYGPGLVQRIEALSTTGISAAFDTAGRGFVQDAITVGVEKKRIVTIVDFEAAALGVQVSTGDIRAFTAAPLVPILAMVDRGKLTPQIARIFPFEEIPDAHTLSETGHFRGKIVVRGVD